MDCTLCGLESASIISAGDKNFCCFGCKTVWQLLSAKGEIENWKEHPIFEQAIKSGLIANPHLKFETKTASFEKKRLLFEINEMWCPSCAEVIEYLVKLEKGTISCLVDYATDLCVVEYDPMLISEDEIFKLIFSIGYRPVQLEKVLGKPVSTSLYLRFFIAAFASLNIMMFSYPLYAAYFSFEMEGWAPLLAWISLIGSLPVVTYSAWPIWKRFYSSLRTGLYGMESLVVIGMTSSLILSVMHLMQGSHEVYFDTLTVIVTFVLLGKIIETKAKFTAKESFYTLSRSLPQRARKEGKFVSLKEILSDDVLEVIAGERIVLDGVVKGGSALVNESAMTGEVLPILKQKDDLVAAGTVVETGRLFYKVDGKTSALDQIVQTCLLNLENKSPYIRALDPIVRVFVPFVLILALISLIIGGTYETALSILLISCPCAIGIAAPLVESRLMQILSHEGALVRNRGVLALLPQINLFAFDKTGTITKGEFVVKGLSDLNEEALRDLKGLALLSRHPISISLAKAIDLDGSVFETVFEKEGAGIEADGLFLGSRIFIEENIKTGPLSQNISSTTEVWFARKGDLFRIELVDELREDVPNLILSLPNTWILSGDRPQVVKKIALEGHFKNWKAELSPFEKTRQIAAFKKEGKKVLFVGDGLNDAAALTEADVGIAVSTSQGLSQAAADILFTKNSLALLPKVIELAKEAQKLIKQNLFWAFIYNLACLPLAFLGMLNPIMAAFAMTLSSLIVIYNSFRFKKR